MVKSSKTTEYLKGTIFTKYGRFGDPKKRLVYISEDETQIVWKNPDKQNDKPRIMLVSELTEVAIGSDHTPVMQKQKMSELYDCQCLSIIGRDRSLDLKYDDSKIIQIWCDSIKQLIEASRQKEQGIQREFLNQNESPN